MKGKLVMTVAEMADHDKWLAARNSGIGGSEAAVIVGMNRWKSPFQLWMEKTGEVEPEDLSNNEFVYWGTVLEQCVADRFAELTGKRVTRRGMLQDEEVPYFFANVDRVIVGENAGLECKTTNAYAKDAWEGDNIPDAYYCQCQWYMGVTGAEKWYIACLIGGNTFVWKEVARSDEDIAALREAAKAFWETNVLGGVMPDADGSKNCAESLLKRFKGGNKEVVDLEADGAAELVQQAQALQEYYDESRKVYYAQKNGLSVMPSPSPAVPKVETPGTGAQQPHYTTVADLRKAHNYKDVRSIVGRMVAERQKKNR